jgi:transposase
MSLARVVITAAVVEGRPKSAVAREYGVSRRWVQILVARYLAEGEAAFEPRSRRPHTSPQRTSQATEDAIVAHLHQTLKKWLARQDPAATISALQAQLDTFTAYCKTARPHRAIGRRTPEMAWNARPRAIPARRGIRISEHFRVRRDTIDTDGKLTLRHNSRLHHIGIGRRWAGTKILILARDLDLRIITQENGELIRELTLDPTRDYQAQAPRV